MGSAFAQTQANGIRRLRANSFAHGQRVLLKRLKGFRPVFAAMNIRAVSEMKTVIQFHNAIEQQRNQSGKTTRQKKFFLRSLEG